MAGAHRFDRVEDEKIETPSPWGFRGVGACRWHASTDLTEGEAEKKGGYFDLKVVPLEIQPLPLGKKTIGLFQKRGPLGSQPLPLGRDRADEDIGPYESVRPVR